jgi:hypothetical protein
VNKTVTEIFAKREFLLLQKIEEIFFGLLRINKHFNNLQIILKICENFSVSFRLVQCNLDFSMVIAAAYINPERFSQQKRVIPT